MWMLDTYIRIDIIKRQPDSVLKKLRSKSLGQIGLASTALGELPFGATRSERPAQNTAALQEFLFAIEVASFDRAAALEYGAVRASLKRSGRPIGSLDALLVTHNTREFGPVAGLRVEKWLQN
jgi:tRNA(fMet)-specific endonuclease VapC